MAFGRVLCKEERLLDGNQTEGREMKFPPSLHKYLHLDHSTAIHAFLGFIETKKYATTKLLNTTPEAKLTDS